MSERKNENNNNNIVPLLMTTKELMQYLNCGRKCAVKLGKQANALVLIGTQKFFWDRKKIEDYINAIRE